MNKVIHKIILDMKSVISQQAIEIQRYDTGRKFAITLSDNGAVYPIKEGSLAVFMATKPDKTILYNHCDIVDNTIVFDLFKNPQLAAAEGEVRCEIRLYGADGTLITSPCFDIIVDKTLYTDNIIESSSEFSELTKAIVANLNAVEAANQAVRNAEASVGNFTGQALDQIEEFENDAEQEVDDAVSNAETKVNNAVAEAKNEINAAVADMRSIVNDSANAFNGAAEGNILRIDDVSPIDHIAKVKVHGKNLIDISTAKPLGVETIEISGDNVVLKNFGPSHYGCRFTDIPLSIGKTYTFSVESTSTHSEGFGWRVMYADDTSTSTSKSNSLTITINKKVKWINFYIAFGELTSVQDVTISKPMCVLGTDTTEYEPYIDPSTLTVTAIGKNLISYPYEATSQTINGITFTVNGDGTIRADGTAKTNTGFNIGNIIGGGNVFVSGCPEGGSIQKYRITADCYKDGSFKESVHDIGNGIALIDDCDTAHLYIMIYAGTTVYNIVFRPQAEIGSSATAYEMPNKAIYIPSSEGICHVASMSPTMTLLTDTEGATIEAEYNRDSNVVVKELYDYIKSIIKSNNLTDTKEL